MRKLATRTAVAALMLGFAMSIGTGPVLAASGSDGIGGPNHCYMLFEWDPVYAQVMISGEEDEVRKKRDEALLKYVDDLEFDFVSDVGNLPAGGDATVTCEVEQ